MIWLKLSGIEWRRSIFFWCRNDNDRDFFWLTTLLALTLALALLVWGSREGLLNSFMNVSLCYVEPVGIPIWVVAENGNGVGIDRDLLENIRAMGITIHPYHVIEWSYVSLPGATEEYGHTPIWTNQYSQIQGWAVSEDDPLWKSQEYISTETTWASKYPITSLFQREQCRAKMLNWGLAKSKQGSIVHPKF